MQIFVDIFLFLLYTAIFLLLLTYIWTFWKMFVNARFLSGINLNTILLEIKLPREISKSPEAMEIISGAFLQSGGVGNWYNRNFKGNLVSFFSLEIASIEGDVRFFVRGEKKYKDIITNNFYSQYPGIEIKEADDYVKEIYYDHRGKSVSLWGLGTKLGESFNLGRTIARDKAIKDDDKSKEDEALKMPADYKMIKTYVDYALDKNPDEEFKHDPLTPILEWLGSMKKGEHAWYQVIIQDTSKYNGKDFGKTYVNAKTEEEFTLKDLAEERIKVIRKKEGKKVTTADIAIDEYGHQKMMKNPKFKMIPDPNDPNKKISNGEEEMIPTKYADSFFTAEEKALGYKYIDDGSKAKEVDLTSGEKDEIEMINRKLSKPLFRAYIRLLYVAKKENANIPNNVQSLLGAMRSFKGANGFVPSPVSDPYDYAWQDSGKKRKPWRSEEMYEGYVEREAFYPHITFRNTHESKLLEFIFDDDDSIDWYADKYFFNKSLGVRKLARLLYEGIFHPYSHPTPNIFTINSEELATLWHLPGQVASTPGIKRVDSLKSDAPTNLPR